MKTPFPPHNHKLADRTAGPPILTRALLEGGGIEALYSKDAPSLQLTSDADRHASLNDILTARPGGDVWVFAYGSLIWNPAVRVVERRTARITGWHRAFCLSMTAGRGSPENPGLVLALEPGGECAGTACRIADCDIEAELAILWRREMLCGGYVPRWVEILDEDDVPFGNAIAFTVDRVSDQYTGPLPTETIVRRLATASGGLGSSADYLFRTRDGLRENGIHDADLEWLAVSVEVALAQRSGERSRHAPTRARGQSARFELG